MMLRVLHILWQHASRYPWTLIGVVVSVVALIGSQTLAPLFYKRLIDTAVAASGHRRRSAPHFSLFSQYCRHKEYGVDFAAGGSRGALMVVLNRA